jgi:hypothetical protein
MALAGVTAKRYFAHTALSRGLFSPRGLFARWIRPLRL